MGNLLWYYLFIESFSKVLMIDILYETDLILFYIYIAAEEKYSMDLNQTGLSSTLSELLMSSTHWNEQKRLVVRRVAKYILQLYDCVVVSL